MKGMKMNYLKSKHFWSGFLGELAEVCAFAVGVTGGVALVMCF